MLKWLSLLLIFCLLLSQTTTAQNRIYVNEYLNIGVGGRGLAMAGSQVASTNDAISGFWNPAGFVHVTNETEIGLMHAEYFSGNAKYDFGSIVKKLKDQKRVIGFSVLRFAVDDIPNTIDFIQPDGSFDESKLKSMSAGDYAFIFSYAQPFKLFKNQKIETSIGGNMKIIYRHLGSMANAWGGGIDFGIQAKYKQWLFGAMAKDLTTTYTAWSFHLTEHEKQVFFQTGNEIPIKSYEVMLPRLNIGFGKYLFKAGKTWQVLPELGLDLTTDGKRNTLIAGKTISIDPHLGLEASYKKTLFFRAGIGNIQKVKDDNDTNNQKQYTIFQPSLGIGLKIDKLVIDYAFTSLQTQSNPLLTHIVSLRLLFDKPKSSAIKTEMKPTTISNP